jgi:hypothetical protein
MPVTSKKKLEYIKRWKEQNREKTKLYEHRYREGHKVERSQYYKKYSEEHPERIREKEKRWREAHPEEYKARYEKYNQIAKEMRLPKRILFYDKRIFLDKNPRTGKCSMCGATGRTEIHHIKYHKDDPLKDTIEVCASCHRKREQLYNEWRKNK